MFQSNPPAGTTQPLRDAASGVFPDNRLYLTSSLAQWPIYPATDVAKNRAMRSNPQTFIILP